MKTISIVVPCFNEEKSLPLFCAELERVVSLPAENGSALIDSYAFELVLVDDGSTDDTLRVMREIAADNQIFSVRYFSFSRNFGKEAALYAGLSNARGDYVATMDADLQDPPSLLPEMIAIVESGEYDNVATRRVSRTGEPAIRSACARLFYKLINSISDTEIVDGARDFRLMTRGMVDAVVSLGEYNRFSKGIFGWVGFRTKWIEFENVERSAGETSWSFFGLLRYSIEGIVAFSNRPLQIASFIGMLLFVFSLIWGIVIIVKTLAFGDPVAGWPSMACIMLFIGGLQLLCLGVVGQYLAKTYLEVKHRPLYIVRETNDEQ